MHNTSQITKNQYGASAQPPVDYIAYMSYALSLGFVQIFPEGIAAIEEECSCETARTGCSPTYVFSILGQVEFRASLKHLASCEKKMCRSLRVKVRRGMLEKLNWLMHEHSLLGCVQIQPYLFGSKRVLLETKHFPYVANHLSICPRESCAQLRRALLLRVRESVKTIPIPEFEMSESLSKP